MSSIKKNEEVTPEALLEQLRNAKTIEDVFDLFEELWSLIMGIALKADTDASTKTNAIHQLGLLSARFYMLLDAYKVAVEHDFSYRDELHDEIEVDLKKLIEVYAYLKKGGSLKEATNTISWISISVDERVRDFMNYLARMVEDLSPRPYY